MSRLLKLFVTGIVATLALSTAALPAHATTDAARAAAAWVAERADTVTEVSGAADAALAVAAAQDPATLPQAEPLLEIIARDGAAAVNGSPESAAKIAIVADAFDHDPRTFVEGVDLVAEVADGIAADGSFGAWPGPFASGLAAVALHRAGAPVPDALITHLLGYANPDGGFGFGVGEASDADNTGMALLALLTADTDTARAAADSATEWATANQADDGSWAGYNPVNSTAVLGGALESAGVDQAEAIAYLTGVQLPSGAFPNNGEEDLLATGQAALLLGEVSYLDVTADASAPLPATTEPAGPVEVSGPGDILPWAIGGGVAAAALIVGWALLRRSRASR